MNRVRVIVAVALLAVLALVAWKVFFGPRPTDGANRAPEFSAVGFGQNGAVKFPADYADSWIWLMFSGKG